MCDDYSESTSDTSSDTSPDTSCDDIDTSSDLPEDTGDLSDDGADELPDDSGEDFDCEEQDLKAEDGDGAEDIQGVDENTPEDMADLSDCDDELVEDEDLSPDTDESVSDESEDNLSDDGSDDLPDGDEIPREEENLSDENEKTGWEEETDLEAAQKDLEFANQQMDEYREAVRNGEIEPDENLEREMQDIIDEAEERLNDVQNGLPYSFNNPSEYWASSEGREIAGNIFGAGMNYATKGIAKASGVDIPPGDVSISEPAKNLGKFYGENYGYKHIGRAADFSKKLMENVYNTYSTPSDRCRQEFFLQDGNGNPITATQAKELAFKDAEPTMHDNLNDPQLFENNLPGNYTYENGENGKRAYGSLEVSDNGLRDAQAQRSAGGESRRVDDDGGHLIGTRFNGAPDSKNIDAQNSNLNRGSYNHLEKSWQNAINNGDKVYVNIETSRSNGSERPDVYMGYSIAEHPNGTREWDAFSYQNESSAQQEEWNRELEEFEREHPDDHYNPMQEYYEKQEYYDE